MTKTIHMESTKELVHTMLDKYDGETFVSCIGYYETVSEVLKEIILASDGSIDVECIELDNPLDYDNLYYLFLYEDGLCCMKLYDKFECSFYVGDYVFIDDDCCKDILDYYDDDGEITFYSFGCNGECENCCCRLPEIEEYENGTYGFTAKSEVGKGYQVYHFCSEDYDEVVKMRDEILG